LISSYAKHSDKPAWLVEGIRHGTAASTSA